jgi:hypothetical protein
MWTHVGMKVVEHEHLDEALIDAGVAVSIAHARHVDDMEADPTVVGVTLQPHGVVGREGILLAREHANLVPLGEPLSERLRVDLGPRVVAHCVFRST